MNNYTRRDLFKLSMGAGLGLATGLSHAASKGYIGLSMPTVALQRWVYDGLGLMRGCQSINFSPLLQFADNDPNIQITQIRDMIKKKPKVIAVAPIDGEKLGPVLQEAAQAGIKIISYDRLILKSPHVDYYTTFDNYQVGVMQGQDIENRLKLKEKNKKYTLEVFAGSPDDNNATFFYNGAMSILKPYIDSGVLVVESKQYAFAQVATPGWKSQLAGTRLENLLKTVYAKKRLDAILSPNDGISVELIRVLKKANLSKRQAFVPPVITGQDADLPGVRAIAKNELSSTVFKDTRELVKVTIKMIDAITNGRAPEINDTKTYNNGIKVVPSFLLKPFLVDASNYKSILIDSGYYKNSEI